MAERKTLAKIARFLNIFTFSAFMATAGFLYYVGEYTASFWLFMAISLQLILNKLETLDE